jgi:hypothetical protein
VPSPTSLVQRRVINLPLSPDLTPFLNTAPPGKVPKVFRGANLEPEPLSSFPTFPLAQGEI